MKQVWFALCLLLAGKALSQNVGIGTASPQASSLLELNSNNKGLLAPRLTAAQRTAIASPATGLLVYDTDSLCFACFNGSAWLFTPGKSDKAANWSVNGNAGTNPSQHFIGTTDDMQLLFRVNNQLSGRIDSVKEVTFFGFGAGQVSAAFDNTAIGFKALRYNTTGNYNTALGAYALYVTSTGTDNTGLGTASLFTNGTGSHNTGAGAQTLQLNTTGSDNTALGYLALYNNTTAGFNTALGSSSMQANETGAYNVATGYKALYANKTGNQNAALGDFALSTNISGSGNVAIGSSALGLTVSGTENVAVGITALYKTTSFDNTGVGHRSLYNNTTGNSNTALGAYSLEQNNIGTWNTGIGFRALFNNTTGSNNVSLGFESAFNLETGSYNTLLGFRANVSTPGWGDAMALGSNTITTANDQVMIGGAYPGIIQIGGYANWSNFSDGRFKENVREDVPGLSFITRLRPVTYQVNDERLIKHITKLMPDSVAALYLQPAAFYKAAYEKRLTGFIAQEVEEAAGAVGFDFDGVNKPRNETDHYSISYASFVVPLVRAVQELSAENEAQKRINADLQRQINELREMLKAKN